MIFSGVYFPYVFMILHAKHVSLDFDCLALASVLKVNFQNIIDSTSIRHKISDLLFQNHWPGNVTVCVFKTTLSMKSLKELNIGIMQFFISFLNVLEPHNAIITSIMQILMNVLKCPGCVSITVPIMKGHMSVPVMKDIPWWKMASADVSMNNKISIWIWLIVHPMHYMKV